MMAAQWTRNEDADPGDDPHPGRYQGLNRQTNADNDNDTDDDDDSDNASSSNKF